MKGKTKKSFVEYFIEYHKIDTTGLACIRTYGWGEKAVLRVEYACFHRDYKPVRLAKKYLWEHYGFSPKNLNLNNAHYDRISCSALNVYDISKEDFDMYATLPSVIHSEYNEKRKRRTLEFAIHNEKQCALCYERKLYAYFE